MAISVHNIFAKAEEKQASDIHISVGRSAIFRIEGALIRMDDFGVMNKDDLDSIKMEMLGGRDKFLRELQGNGESDFSFLSKTNVSYRVNGFFRRGKLSFAFRRIANKPKSLEQLGLPLALYQFLKAEQGLVLVTGPTGSGKSTTLVACLEQINRERDAHILTIEDPVEFLFEDNKSFFSQREIGADTHSFVNAIRAAMREDPDIVMIGEMRDPETVEAAINLAETGHLVFSTLHTAGSVSTINRVLQFFPPTAQNHVRTRLADALLCVLSQRLIPRSDIPGRVAIYELMIATMGIQNLIRSGDLAQVNNAIEMGRELGMIPMRLHAKMLEKEGIIKKDDYIGFFTRENAE